MLSSAPASLPASAATREIQVHTVPLALPYLACMLQASQFYTLPPRVLPSIQAVEGGAPGTVHQNTDGSADLGVMQVNTRWVQPIARRIHDAPDNVAARLTNDACFNIAAAALILRGYLNETHDDLMEAVGDYHSHTRLLNLAYRTQVVAVAAAMFGTRR
jgi:soluble lytic murein transglycosylase-like protein